MYDKHTWVHQYKSEALLTSSTLPNNIHTFTGRGSVDSPETENELIITVTARLNDVDGSDIVH
jgi:hypothetical protein